jgi:uncharacterized DUF497 family protein
MLIRRLVWDDWNEEHVARHGIVPREVRAVCLSNQSLGVRIRRGRYRIIGQTDEGRYLTVYLDVEDLEMASYYVVTARDATPSERRRLRR